jgi:MAF protein
MENNVTSTNSKRIILASGSPRRREMLGWIGLSFDLVKTDIDETYQPGEMASAYTVRLSQTKAQAARDRVSGEGLILAADTTVADGDLILGKPADADEARSMLRQLRGRVHQVHTALTLLDITSGRQVTETAMTDVPMRDYTEREMEDYIAQGNPFDKAGGYAIQHAPSRFSPPPMSRWCANSSTITSAT